MIAVGDTAPDFTLLDQDGEPTSLSDFRGKKLLIVFYPGDFSPVCSDQFSVYQQGVAGELAAAGIDLIGISVDSFFAHKAFQEKLGVDTRLLSDFEPKGAVAKTYDSYFEPMGFANRTLVLVDEDGKVAWTYESPSPGEFPGPDIVREALTA
jgi:peroxiredoxin